MACLDRGVERQSLARTNWAAGEGRCSQQTTSIWPRPDNGAGIMKINQEQDRCPLLGGSGFGGQAGNGSS